MDVNVEDEERHAALIKSRGPHQVGKNTYIYIYLKINHIKHIICDKLAVIYIYIDGFRVPHHFPTAPPHHRSGRVRLRSVVSDGSFFRSKSNG